jgi:hypothetical protein
MDYKMDSDEIWQHVVDRVEYEGSQIRWMKRGNHVGIHLVVNQITPRRDFSTTKAMKCCRCHGKIHRNEHNLVIHANSMHRDGHVMLRFQHEACSRRRI